MKPTKTDNILKSAKLILRERELEQQLQAVRSQRRAMGNYCSSAFSGSEERKDLSVQIDLGEYLTAFPDKSIKPKAGSFESDDLQTVNGEIVTVGHGVKHYMTYPAQFVGTIPSKPPTHVWATASTDSVWAPGDPKPIVAEAQKAA